MIKELRKEIVYVQYHGDMVHGMWTAKIKIGDIWINEESNRSVLVMNAKFFFWDFQLKEQQILLQVFTRGYYEFDKENYIVSELYNCFLDLIDEISRFNIRAEFGDYIRTKPTIEEFSEALKKMK